MKTHAIIMDSVTLDNPIQVKKESSKVRIMYSVFIQFLEDELMQIALKL